MIAMTDAECAEILAEFRKLRLGPELSAAMDHAIGVLRLPKFGEVQYPADWLRVSPLGPRVSDHGSGGSIAGGAHDGVLMNGVAA